MKKAIADKTPLAAWATLARDEAGMSVEEVVDALAALGHSVTAATIRGIEGGSKGASARLRKLLAQVYGVTSPTTALDATESVDTGMAALIAALAAQTAAMADLVNELREARGETADLRTRVAAAEDYAKSHERLFQADRARLGLGPTEGEHSEGSPPVASRS